MLNQDIGTYGIYTYDTIKLPLVKWNRSQGRTGTSMTELFEMLPQGSVLSYKYWQQAVACYTKAVELDGSCHVYKNNRAAAYIKLERFAEAIEDCNVVLKQAKGLAKDQQVKCMYRKGLGLAGLAKHSAACEVFREALRTQKTIEKPIKNIIFH